MIGAYVSDENRFNLKSNYDIGDRKSNKKTYTRVSSYQLLKNPKIENAEISMSDIIKTSYMLPQKPAFDEELLENFKEVLKEKINCKLA